MRFLISLLVGLVVITSVAKADGFEKYIVEGNKQYDAKAYEKAVASYEKVLKSGYESAVLYYNLGNAYYRTGKFTKAIINYERAKRLSPNDEAINSNLKLMQNHVVDKIEAIPEFFFFSWIQNIRYLLSSDAWAISSIVGFVIVLVMVAFFLFTTSQFVKKLAFFKGVFLLLIVIVTFIFAYQQKQSVSIHNTAIITTPAVTVKSSPGSDGTDLFQLHEGTKVTITDEEKQWYEIKLANGSVGWLKAEEMEVI